MSGYDTKIFVKKPSDSLICALCLNVVNDPRQCPNGHVYCVSCISGALNRRSECPTCKVQLSHNALGRCLFVQETIQQLSTYCISSVELVHTSVSGEKCQWIGTLENRILHYERSCDHYPVTCELCDMKVSRHKLQLHLTSECLNRPVTCEYCNKSYNFNKQSKHTMKCEEFPITCPNECRQMIRRKSVNEHLGSSCTLQLIGCPLYTAHECYQCTGKVRRCDMLSHLSDLNRHTEIRNSHALSIQNLVDLNAKQTMDIEDLRAEIAKLRATSMTECGDTKGKHCEIYDQHCSESKVAVASPNVSDNGNVTIKNESIKLESTSSGVSIQSDPTIMSKLSTNQRKIAVSKPQFDLMNPIYGKTVIEYLNRKDKWIRALVLNDDVETGTCLVLNAYNLQLTVSIDNVRLVDGTFVFHSVTTMQYRPAIVQFQVDSCVNSTDKFDRNTLYTIRPLQSGFCGLLTVPLKAMHFIYTKNEVTVDDNKK